MTTVNLNLVRPAEALPFIYRGFRFICTVEQVSSDAFQPHVRYESGMQEVAAKVLPDDTAPYKTMAEARRHAQQQAVRWVHDQQGHGTGQM